LVLDQDAETALTGVASALLCCMNSARGKGFEQLLVWQRARLLCSAVRPIVAKAEANHDYALSQQLNRATLSVMANIAEGYLRRSRKEFAQFVRIAAGSNGEVRACLYAAGERGYIQGADVDELVRQTNEIGGCSKGRFGS
jgi:four helix bundle protein